MKIAVCVRVGTDGAISPFEEAAYEAALRLGGETVLLSMGPPSARDALEALSRLGAKKTILLSDPAFAGADTLATAYTLSLAVKKLAPELVFCGRKTLEGDTAQVGAMLSVYAGFSFLPGAMDLPEARGGEVFCRVRGGEKAASLPAVLSFERAFSLRLPRLGSRPAPTEVLTAKDLGGDPARYGLAGSPTRVTEGKENPGGRRKCTFLPPEALLRTIEEAAKKEARAFCPPQSETKLPLVCSVGEAPAAFARAVGERVEVLDPASDLPAEIKKLDPDAVLFAGDAESRALSALTAARMDLGLSADCTALETDGKTLFMIRPAKAGSVLAKIRSLTRPAMASVHTEAESGGTILAAGAGAKGALECVKAFAAKIGAEVCASRKAVDLGLFPYSAQVGLTGRVVSPRLYLAVGVSGAVQHLVGMERSGTVIAVDPDPRAPIFDYADYGFLMRAEDLPLH